MTIDVSRTAFRGFSLVAQKPWVVLVWALIYLLGFVVICAVAVGLAFAAGIENFVPSTDPAAPPDYPVGALLAIIPVVIIGFLALMSVFLCGAYRLVLCPEEGGLAYLRLGGAEVRMMGLLFVSALMWLLLYSGVMLGAGMLGAITVGIGLLVAIPAALALLLFLAVKMSLAAVINFAEGSFGIAESWKLTDRNFWNLFLVYLIVFAVLMVIAVAFFMIQSAAQGAVGLPTIFNLQAGQTTPEYTGAALAVTVVLFVAQMLVSSANMIFSYAPHAEAYLQLKPKPADRVGDVFS